MNVPCNGCTACCHNDVIILTEGDRTDYETTIWHGKTVLKQRENGDCVYLGSEGCTIHDSAPIKCKSFDCKTLIEGFTRVQRRKFIKEGKLSKEIVRAAHRRMKR